MSGVKFNHVFSLLLLLCAVSAFVFPKQTSGVRAHVQGIFYPVAKPARWVAFTLRPPESRLNDRRPTDRIVEENERLRVTVANLAAQIDLLQERVAEGERLGRAGKNARRVAVMGSDPSARDSLSVVGRFDPTLLNQPALYGYGLVGRFERAGLTGAQIRLITDRSFSVTGRFLKPVSDGIGGTLWEPLRTDPPLVEGQGNGLMMITNIEYDDAIKAGIDSDTSVVLEDREYPPALMHQKLGRVESVKRRPEAPLWADIAVRPEWNLMALTQVWVLPRAGAGEASAMTE